jgi:hypothetical protein
MTDQNGQVDDSGDAERRTDGRPERRQERSGVAATIVDAIARLLDALEGWTHWPS